MSAGPLPSSCFHDALSCWILQAHVLCFSLSSRMPAGHGGLMLPPNGDSPQILVLPFTFRMIIHLELHFVLSCRSGKAHFSEYGRNRRISPPPPRAPVLSRNQVSTCAAVPARMSLCSVGLCALLIPATNLMENKQPYSGKHTLPLLFLGGLKAVAFPHTF